MQITNFYFHNKILDEIKGRNYSMSDNLRTFITFYINHSLYQGIIMEFSTHLALTYTFDNLFVDNKDSDFIINFSFILCYKSKTILFTADNGREFQQVALLNMVVF